MRAVVNTIWGKAKTCTFLASSCGLGFINLPKEMARSPGNSPIRSTSRHNVSNRGEIDGLMQICDSDRGQDGWWQYGAR